MAIKRITTVLLLMLVMATTAMAQRQHGQVKSKGRLTASGRLIPGRPLDGTMVKVRGRNAVVSHANGAFSFPLPSQTFYLEQVQRQGYVLTDPEMLTRQYTYSKNPLMIVMELPDEQLEEQLELMTKIRNTLQDRLARSRAEMKALREQNAITQAEYQQRLAELVEQQNHSATLISEMVNRYARTDFDQVDEFNRRISVLILDGMLTEADSLLKTKGDIMSRIADLKKEERIEQEESAELVRRSRRLEKLQQLVQARRDDVAQDCYHYAEMFKLRHQNDSALFYLELRALVDTTNVTWQMDVGRFLVTYLGDGKKAQRYYECALRHATDSISGSQDSEALAYLGMGSVYDLLGDYSRAMDYYSNAENIWLQSSDTLKAELGTLYNNMGVCLRDMGEYRQSIDFHRKSMELQLSAFGGKHPGLCANYLNIGNVYNSLGDTKQALIYQQKGLDLALELYGEEHPNVVAAYIGIGNVYYYEGDYPQAVDYTNKALAISKAIYGERHHEVAVCYNNIGYVQYLEGAYEESLKSHQESLAIRQEILGERHASVAQSYDNIGMVWFAMGNYDEAFNAHSHALDIRKQVQGTQHPDLAWSYIGLGDVLAAKGNTAEARTYYQQAYSVRRAALGDTHPETVAAADKLNGLSNQ